MTKGIFITATGTDAGETYVSGLLVKKLRDNGINCGYYKPALCGMEERGGKLIPGDVDFVLKTAGIDDEPQKYVSYSFKPAVSPHLAAQIENNPIKLSKIKADFDNIKQNFDYIVVEGAGGIICPFNLTEEKILLPDVIKELKTDIIIVAPASLGTINSTFLTVEYAKSQNINVKGIILNNYTDGDIMQEDNKKVIEDLTGVKVIATVKDNEKDLQIDTEYLLRVFKEI